MAVHRLVNAFLGESFEHRDAEQMRARALSYATRLVGCDQAVFVSHTNTFFAQAPAYIVTYLADPAYRRALPRAFAASRQRDGIYADATVFTAGERSRGRFFVEVLDDHHIRSQLVAVVHFAGRVTGVLHLNRGHADFDDDDVARLRPFMRVVGLVHAAIEKTPTPLDQTTTQRRLRLTPREHEVSLLVARGRTNGEIADILGTSISTVRHQVEAVLRKCGADNRAAVAALVQHDLALERARPRLPAGVAPATLATVWNDMVGSIPAS